ncbi:MAG: HAD-IA family hydrolase [Bacilli bacterium]|nr:HAD-IA family hydrolase [Bacilli bacterium]
MYAVAVALGILLICICIFSHLKNSRNMTLIMKLAFDITATTYLTAVYFATGAVGVFAGIAINGIGIIRSIIFLFRYKNKFFDNNWCLLSFEIIQALSLIISYTSPISIIPTIASMFTTYALFINKQKVTKSLIIVAQSMFITYYALLLKDSDLLTILMLVSCCVTLSSSITGLILIFVHEKKPKYKCVIFDLDGTLVDSLQGILNALNKTFKDFDMNIEKGIEEGKAFIGAGSREFVRRALVDIEMSPEEKEKFNQKFLVHYDETQKTDAKLYDGIEKLIINLKEKGTKVCIATNKPEHLLIPLINQLFKNVTFDALLGNKEGRAAKPNPQIVYEIIDKFGLRKEECIYVGDSEYDYLTAYNSGINCLIVTYGYGFYSEEWGKEVKNIVKSVPDMAKFLK